MKVYKTESRLIQVVSHTLCDCCNHVLSDKQLDLETFKIVAESFSWGEDNVIVDHTYDLCSFDCFHQQLNQILTNPNLKIQKINNISKDFWVEFSKTKYPETYI